jgi:hypothetical protein
MDIIHASAKIREQYKNLKIKRSKTILLSNQEYLSLEHGVGTGPPIETKPKAVTQVSNLTCRAYKMDGNICNAKAKCGDFCNRHKKSTI